MINNIGYKRGRYKRDSKSFSTRRNTRDHTTTNTGEKGCGYFSPILCNVRIDAGGLNQLSSSFDNNSISLPTEYIRGSNAPLFTARPTELSVSVTVTQPLLNKKISTKLESISYITSYS